MLDMLKDFGRHSPLLRPVRAMILAYSYVLTGRKFEKPVPWASI